ncbi:MAG TPA: S41 family peptidase [Aggregatilineaceae bacterium]|nr:S41 family peptidase [Aggregatilineaceae bacterium]
MRYHSLAIIVLVVALAFPPFTLTATAQQKNTQPRFITGTYATTNPIYPQIGAEHGIILFDLYGQIAEDYAFVSPPAAQTLGTAQGDITSGTYQIELPETPQGTLMDFDGDRSTPPGVQVFTTATYINFIGDEYINRGETVLDESVHLEPMSYAIIGGYVLVWAVQDGEQFPSNLGPDGAAFTGDESLMSLPAGWSVIALDTEPFSIIRQETVDLPIMESLGALNDYSSMSYEDAWNRLFQRTKETYPFAAEKQLDWDAIYKTITPLVKAATDDVSFHLAIAYLGELIPDTHIGYASVSVLQNLLIGGVGISALAVTSSGEVIVTGLEEGLPAQTAGIDRYNVLLEVDGTPALKALDETPLLLNSASTEQSRRFFQAATLLQGPIGSEVTLTWRSSTGKEYTDTLTREFDASSILAAFDTSSNSDHVITSQMLDSGLGYISVRGFAEEVSTADELFSSALQNLVDAGAQGIIIDVRNNTGGLVNLAMAMAGHFFPDYSKLFDFYYADGQGGFAYRGFVEILKGKPYYEGPVAILVNEMTGSAGDLFTYAMTLDNRALIVGNTPTGGFTGEVSDGQYTLPGSLSVQIPTGRPVNPVTGETLIEGIGVQPDVVVPITQESLVSSDDEVLLAAEQALLEFASN